MDKKELPKFVIVFIISTVCVFSAFAKNDPVVADVNGQKIHQSDIIRAQKLLPEKYRENSIEVIFPALLNSLIDSYLTSEYAKKRNYHKTPEFAKEMERVKRRVLQRITLSRVIAGAVTDDSIKERFETLKAGVLGKKEIRARHILLKTKEEADKIILELDKGANFIDLAKERSIGPSASSGGDLGYFGRGQMVPAFEKAAFDLEEGVYNSIPIKTQFGWHIILSEGARDKSLPIFEESVTNIKNQLSQEAVTNLLDSLRNDARIKSYNFDGSLLTEGK